MKQTLGLMNQLQSKLAKHMHRLKGVREASVVLSDMKSNTTKLEDQRKVIFALHVEGEEAAEGESKKKISAAAKVLGKVAKLCNTVKRFDGK